MAYQSELELRVKVVTKELDELEQRLNKLKNVNPFDVSGARKRSGGQAKQQLELKRAELNVDKSRLQLEQRLAVGRVKELNDRTKLVALLRQGQKIQASYARDSERAAAAARKQKSSAASSAIIGGAFPLLFGQGIGAAAGGGVGGAAGGFAGGQFGFGLSLVGTALGAAVDSFIENAGKLASSLKSPEEALKALETAGFTVSEKTKQAVDTLLEFGDVIGAQNIVFAELARTFGPDAVNQLAAYDQEQKKLNQTLEGLKAQLASELLPTLLGAAKAINVLKDSLGGITSIIPDWLKTFVDMGVKSTNVVGQIQLLLTEIGKITGRTEGPRAKAELSNLDERKQAELRLQQFKRQQELLTNAKTVQDIVLSYKKADADRAKQQRNYIRQAADIAENYEKQLASLREKVEDRILQLRLKAIAEENRALDIQGQNRLKRLDIEHQQALLQLQEQQASTGKRSDVAELERELTQIFQEYEKNSLSVEEQKAKLARDSALEVMKLELENEKFKVDIAKQVSQLNISTAKQVRAINENIAQRNNEVSRLSFAATKEENRIRLRGIDAEFKLLESQFKLLQEVSSEEQKSTISDIISDIGTALNDVKKAITFVQDVKPPKKISEVAGPALGGVSTARSDIEFERVLQARAKALQEQLNALDLQSAKGLTDLQTRLAAERNKSIDATNKLIYASNDALESQVNILNDLRSGYSKQQAAAVDAVRMQEKQQLRLIETYKEYIEKRIKQREGTIPVSQQAADPLLTTLRNELQLTEKTITQIDVAFLGLEQDAINATSSIAAYMQELGIGIYSVQDQVVSLATTIETEFASSMSSAIDVLVTGTGTVEETLQQMFNNIGKAFINMATQIIAKQLILITLQNLFRGLMTGQAPINPLKPLAITNPLVQQYDTSGNIPVVDIFEQRASGGPVGAGKTYMVGERGPELFVPKTSGAIIPNHALGGGTTSVTVNVDASGTNVSGNSNQASQLGKAISVAVQAELVKQKRPGGLLAGI